ncbi:hypothetical protein NQZ79_g521 [Umbelopsis isabellina]|nr:hypothetical protein NQZ79_g521 [Umbelopsis isabellina]
MTINSNINQLFSNYEIPISMAEMGFTLLNRIIDFELSNAERIVLRADSTWHVISGTDRCINMIYLLVKHIDDPNRDINEIRNSHINIYPHTRLYVGQTVNFRDRERHRRNERHLMAGANLKICLAHNSSHYQMDCLESTGIAASVLLFGLRTVNASLYPRYIYPAAVVPLSIDDTSDHPDPAQGIGTIGLLRRSLIVAIAPPATLLNNPIYQRNLARWRDRLANGIEVSNPVVTPDLSNGSPTFTHLTEVFDVEVDDLPTFIDHYPDYLSDNYDGIRRQLNIDDIRIADAGVRRSVDVLNRDVVIMLGARPTLLHHHPQRTDYFTQVCTQIELYWLTTTRCGFMIWWPHSGLRRYTTVECRKVLEQIFRLQAHQLYLLLWKLNSMSAPGLGLPATEAQNLLLWFKRQPVTSQIHGLLNDLSNMWSRLSRNVVSEITEDHDMLVSMQLNYIPVEELATVNRNVIEDPSLCMFPERLERELPPMTLSEVSGDWSPTSTTRFTRECVELIPNYSALPEAEQARALRQAANRQYEFLMQARLERYIRLGLFAPQPEESPRDQWSRLWRQVNMSLTIRGYDPRSEYLTCCWCGQVVKKTIQQDRDKCNIGTRREGCPNEMAHTLGWEIVRGDHSQVFPDGNFFRLFFESLPSAIVINNWQIARAFLKFMSKNLWHPQASQIWIKYSVLVPLLENYRTDSSSTSALATTLMKAIRKAMNKLRLIQPPCEIKIVERDTYNSEKNARKQRSFKRVMYAIRVPENDAQKLKLMEDFTFEDYGRHFGL